MVTVERHRLRICGSVTNPIREAASGARIKMRSLFSVPLHLRRTLVGVIAYLVGFAILLWFVCHHYLIPAMTAAKTATPEQKRVLVAHSRLILALLLVILLVGLLLTFRVGRFFLPRSRHASKPTNYPDAWSESARRLG